jgi:hypothetical protein
MRPHAQSMPVGTEPLLRKDDPKMVVTPATSGRGRRAATDRWDGCIIDDEAALVSPGVEDRHGMAALGRRRAHASLQRREELDRLGLSLAIGSRHLSPADGCGLTRARLSVRRRW